MTSAPNEPTKRVGDNPLIYRVLVVDDHEAIRKQIKWCLEGLFGVEVLLAEDGQQGLEMMLKHRPSLVILDLMMPVMDGFKFLEARKSLEDIRFVPVVVLTAQETNEDTITRVLMSGATDYLRKPIDAIDLSQYIEARVKLAERQQAVRQHQADLQHNMSNPLTAVIAFAHILQEENVCTNPNEVKRLARQIEHSSDRIRQVIDQLLTGTDSSSQEP